MDSASDEDEEVEEDSDHKDDDTLNIISFFFGLVCDDEVRIPVTTSNKTGVKVSRKICYTSPTGQGI